MRGVNAGAKAESDANSAGLLNRSGQSGNATPFTPPPAHLRLRSPGPVNKYRHPLEIHLVVSVSDEPQDGNELVKITDDLDIGLLRCVGES